MGRQGLVVGDKEHVLELERLIGHDNQAGLFQVVYLVGQDVLDQVNSASLKLSGAGGGFGNGTEDHGINHRLALITAVPVVLVGRQRDMIVGHPLDEGERAGAHRSCGESFCAYLSEILGWQHCQAAGQAVQQGAVRPVEDHAYGMIVHDLHSVDSRELALVGCFFLAQHALHRELDCLGGEGLAVVKDHTVA